jgi:hypothetical protein
MLSYQINDQPAMDRRETILRKNHAAVRVGGQLGNNGFDVRVQRMI